MSTHSQPVKTRKAAKPSLDEYSIFEKTSHPITANNNENKNIPPEQEYPLKKSYEKSISFQQNKSEKLLSEHEKKLNANSENLIKEKIERENTPKKREKYESEKSNFILPNHLTEIEKSRKTIEKKLKELESRKKISEKDQDNDNIGEFDDEIIVLKKALANIDTLQKQLSANNSKTPKKENRISDGHSSEGESTDSRNDKESDLSPQSKSNLTKIIIKRTTTKQRPTTIQNTELRDSSGEATSRVSKKIDQNDQDDILEFTNIEDRKKVIRIDNKILKYSKQADELLSEITECKENLKELDKSNESAGEKFSSNRRKTEEKRLEKLEHDYAKLICDIGELFLKRSSLGKAFLSPPVKESSDPEHIVCGISKETNDLEKKYKEKLDTYKAKVNYDPAVEENSSRWNLLGGALAFSSSFLLTNTATRLMGLSSAVPPWVGLVFAPVVAGTLHTVVATPTAKQFMLRTWKSPVMAEMNNYFRLMGAYWHDQHENKLHEKKYASKNPDNDNPLTIEERLKEERAFSSIFSDRYRLEEHPYLSYAVLYSLKGILQTVIFNSIHPSASTAITIDTITHAIAGFCSGAIYLDVQQSRRSQLPGNTVDVNPTREIYQAQTEWLTSLRSDLQKMIAELEAVNKVDPRLRELSIKLHKTEVELLTAAAKTGRFTAWLHDFKAQFKPEVLADTLADIAGRIVSLYPTAVVNHFCASLRKSSNPFLVMLSYILPAVSLIVIPGFQARGIYGGIIRACIQSVYGAGAASDKKEKAEHHHVKSDEEDDSVFISISESDSETDSEEEIQKNIRQAKNNDQWVGQPLKRDEELV